MERMIDKLDDMIKIFGPTITRTDMVRHCEAHDLILAQGIYQFKVARGVYSLEAYRNKVNNVAGATVQAAPESEAEMEAKINERFASLDYMAAGVCEGSFRSMVVSGNPGIGKTFGLEAILDAAQEDGTIEYRMVRGYVKPTGLFKLLWETRQSNQVLVFDDADSVFFDEVGLNLLKGALDTTKRRRISWNSEKVFEDEEGEVIPKGFDYEGSVIFVTNLDFERLIGSGNKLAPHMEALMSRSYYLDLNLTRPEELLVRIKSVVRDSAILDNVGIHHANQKALIVDYVVRNAAKLRELSLRSVIKLGNIMRASKGDMERFQAMANSTLCRR